MSNQRWRVALGVLARLAILILFLPYFSAAALAFIFFFAFLGARDRYILLPRKKKKILQVATGFGLILFVGLFVSSAQTVIGGLSKLLDPNFLQEFKDKAAELTAPYSRWIHDSLGDLLNPVGGSQAVQRKISQSLSGALDAFFSLILKWVSEIPGQTLQIVFFIYLLIFLTHRYRRGKLQTLVPFDLPEFAPKIFQMAKASGFNAVVATVLTAFAQASILSIGAVTVGIPSWPIVFFFAFFSAMLPVVGILPVSIVTIVYIASQSGAGAAIILTLFAVTASVADNLIRPYLISNKENSLSPMMSFFALLGGLFIFGFPGLFIGPFLILFSGSLLELDS